MTSRDSRRPPRRRSIRDDPNAVAIFVGALAGSVGFLMPWYAANLAAPFAAGDRSGISLGLAPKAAFALAAVVALSGLLVLADSLDMFVVDGSLVRLATIVAATLGAIATTLVGLRVAVPPGLADFQSRRFGLYLSFVGLAVATVASGLRALRT